jgi:hypothetical protein
VRTAASSAPTPKSRSVRTLLGGVPCIAIPPLSNCTGWPTLLRGQSAVYARRGLHARGACVRVQRCRSGRLFSSTSGLRGVLMRGPTRPVCRVSEPCETAAVGVVLQFRRSSNVVAEVKTGTAGRYKARLRPGTYAVRTTQPSVGRSRPARPADLCGSGRRLSIGGRLCQRSQRRWRASSAIESGPSSPLRAPHGQNQIIATIQGALNRIGRNQIHQGSLVAIG